MRKRTFPLLIILSLLLATAARADVVWEPNNSFYETHWDECEYVGRSFYANGPEGYVTLWDAPGGATVAAQFENGTILRVYWQYKDWGCVTVWRDDGKSIDGWIPMADLFLIYDHISFAEEYAGQISDYNGEFSGYEGDIARVNFYSYPGAESVRTSFDLTRMPEVLERLTGADGHSYISSIFVDEQGLTWGYVGYLYGYVEGWFCLDQPDGEGFPVRQVYPAPANDPLHTGDPVYTIPPNETLHTGDPEEADPDAPPADDAAQRSAQPDLIPAAEPKLPAAAYLPWILVGGVAAVTIVLLVLLRRRSGTKRP